MLAPDIVQVPASVLVSVPLPVPTMLDKLPPCAPPSVKPNPEPVMVPALVMAMVPVPHKMELALPKVIKPAYVAAAPLFISAPPLDTPVPFKVRASAVPKL